MSVTLDSTIKYMVRGLINGDARSGAYDEPVPFTRESAALDHATIVAETIASLTKDGFSVYEDSIHVDLADDYHRLKLNQDRVLARMANVANP